MELMHVLTGFNDIRDSIPPYADSPNDEGDIGNFDETAFSKGMHPTAYTKAGIKWLDGSAIAQHGDGAASYALHAVGLVQPPPTGRWAAVRIGQQGPVPDGRSTADGRSVRISKPVRAWHPQPRRDRLPSSDIGFAWVSAEQPHPDFPSDYNRSRAGYGFHLRFRRYGACNRSASRRVLRGHRNT